MVFSADPIAPARIVCDRGYDQACGSDALDSVFGKLDGTFPDDVRGVTRCAVSPTELPEPAGMTAVVARAKTSRPDADSEGVRDGPLQSGQRRSAHRPPDRWGGVGRHRPLGPGKEYCRELEPCFRM